MYIALNSLTFKALTSAAILCVFCLLAWLVRLWKYYARHFHYGDKFPGPKTIPIFGNALQLNGSRAEIFKNFVDLMFEYKTHFRLWIGWQLLVFVNKPEDAQIILNKALAKPSLYNLFFAQGDSLAETIPLWKKHRKLMNPAFRTKVLDTFLEVFTSQTEVMCKELNSKVGEKEFDIYNCIIQCTLGSLFETSLGTRLDKEEDKKIYDHWSRIFEIITKRICNLLLRPDFIFLRTKYGMEFTKCKNHVFSLIERVIQEKKVQSSVRFRQNCLYTADTKDQDDTGIKKSLPLIDLLLDAAQRAGCKEEIMSDEAMRDEIVIIMIAGTDTSATVLCSALILLGMHPEIQDKAFSEISDIFGDSDKLPELDDLKQLSYLDRVLKEAMRLLSVGIVLARGADEDIELSDKSIIPRDAVCLVSTWRLHRDPDIWPDPTRFDPDRFLPEEVAKRHPYSYLPFSAGPRICIGMKYAMMSMLVMLSTILRRYKVHCDYKMEDIKMEFSFITTTDKGYRVRLERRARKY